MLRLKKTAILSILCLLIAFSCKKADELSTLADFLSRDDSDPKIPREYKTWVLTEGSIAIKGQPIIVYKKGQPIQGNFDPSKISFVFSANKTYQGTDEKGKPESGRWEIADNDKKLVISNTNTTDTFDIIQITRDNFDIQNTESVDGKPAIVTLKLTQNK
jgi:hypothetical protein